MPISVRWDDETKTIAVYTLQGECSHEEMNNAQLELSTLTSSVNHKVGVIMDLREGGISVVARTVQIGGRERRVIRGDFGTSQKVGGDAPASQIVITVFLVPEVILNSTGDVFRKIVEVTGANAVFASTIEDTRKIIADYLSKDGED